MIPQTPFPLPASVRGGQPKILGRRVGQLPSGRVRSLPCSRTWRTSPLPPLFALFANGAQAGLRWGPEPHLPTSTLRTGRRR